MPGTSRLLFATIAALGAHDTGAHGDVLQPIVPTIVEYHWHFLVPHWVVDHRIVRPPVSVGWQGAPARYALPDFDLVSRKIGVVPEFECKYVDFWLPNQCTTHWRDVYVDVPVPVMRPDSIDVDVPRVKRPGDEVVVDVPRLEWKEETLVVSLPALAVAGCRASRVGRPERCAP
jgi:hypothetical protein